MNKATLLTVSAVLTLISASRAEMKLVAIDPSESRVTVSENGIHLFYRLKPQVQVTLNGAATTLDKVRAGSIVSIIYSDPKTISRLAVIGLPINPSAPMPAAQRPAAPRNIHVSLNLDGKSRFMYNDGKFWIEHISHGKPKDITINGVEWKPTWDGKESQPFTAFPITPLPVGQGRLNLKQIAGREKATLVKPTSSKFEKIPTVEIADAPGDADDYEFILSW